MIKQLYAEIIGGEITKPGVEALGEKLAVAIGRKEPFSYRHLRSVMNGDKGFESPGAQLTLAAKKLAAMHDEQHPLSVALTEVTVYAVGNIQRGAIVLANSRICAYPPCGVSFVPKAWNGKYCCPEHNLASKRLRRKKK